MKRLYYSSNEERDEILLAETIKGHELIKEAKFFDGNYLEFDTKENDKLVQLETALMETTMLLAQEQQKNVQNEQAIMELTMLIAGGVA